MSEISASTEVTNTKQPVVKKDLVAAAKTANIINTPLTPLESYEKKMKRVRTLVHGMLAGTLNGVVITGSPGIGKSHNVMDALNQYGDKINVTEVKGHITPFSVFTTLMNNCEENDVILFDDADSCFQDVGSLNLLKAACDTKESRVVTWLSSANKGEQSFVFKGKVVILTNASLRTSPHFKAMLDRFVAYDPDVNLEEKLHKIRDLAENDENIPPEIGEKVLNFLFMNQARLGEISIRTFVKTSDLARSLADDDWEDMAEAVILDK